MNFKLLHLRNARKFITNSATVQPDKSDRRRFIKTMGLSVLAVNPITETIKSLNFNSFEIRIINNVLTVIRNDKVAWEISDRFFEKDYEIKLESGDQSYFLRAKNLRVRNTDLHFSLIASIKKVKSEWIMKILIPELSLETEVNFVNWLEKNQTINSIHFFDQQLIELNETDGIELNGSCEIEIASNWKIVFKGKEQVIVQLNGKKYLNDNLLIKPFEKNSLSFTRTFDDNSVAVTVSRFKGWGNHLEQFLFYENNRIAVNEDTPDLNILLHKTKYGDGYKALWVSEEHGNLHYWPDLRMEEKFILDKYFYFSEYTDTYASRFYLTGKLKQEGQWISNPLGGFKFQNDDILPVFESFGADNKFIGHIFEPRLMAFQPIISDATTLPFYFTPPNIIQINPYQTEYRNGRENELIALNTIDSPFPVSETDYQDPRSKIKKTDKSPINITNVPSLKISFDDIRFVPKRAIKITVLRPEDLLFLQFEFHNFKFSNRGQAPYLELDDPKNKGVVVVFFPSQHTLEQAFFESNSIPTSNSFSKLSNIASSNGEPILPVMQIRARKSRLVYELEAGHVGFPLMMEELLDWSKFDLRVHPRAWIKLPNLLLPNDNYVIIDKIAQVRVNNKDKFLDRDVKLLDFGIRLNQNNRIKSQNNLVYSEQAIEKILKVEKAESVGNNFSIFALQNVNLTVGPIPDTSTSIEAPALMYISPNQINDFKHKIKLEILDLAERKVQDISVDVKLRALDSTGSSQHQISELWHTRLGTKLKNGKISISGLDSLKTIRVLWADDALVQYNKPAPERDTPFLASLDGNNRHKLVHQTSDYAIPGFSPIPIPVKNLMLSSLGAYLNWHVFFNIPSPTDTFLNISEWEHIATLGRDHYVKIVEKGYLFPFGHRAAIVKVTERKFHQQTRSAVNRQRMYIVVLQKEVLYKRNDPDGKFIEFPFQEVRIETSTTPNIDKPTEYPIISGTSAYNFYIKVGGEGFKFDILSTDMDGFEHRFRMPLVFLENVIARNDGQMKQIIALYNKKTDFTLINFWNQRIAYSPCLVDGDTTFETETINFGSQSYPAKGDGDIKFHPKVQIASVYIKQLEEITGVRKAASITLEDDNNAGQVFAKVTGAVLDFSGGSDKSGGFLSPNMSISGLSKLQGPMGGDISDIKNLSFKADQFFKALDGIQSPKIFGVIDIFSLVADLEMSGKFDSLIAQINAIRTAIEDAKNEILYLENQAKEKETVADDLKAKIAAAKKTITEKVKELLAAMNGNIPKIPNFKSYFTEEAAYAEYKWQPQLKGDKIPVISGILNVNVTNPATALSVLTKFEKPFDAGKPAVLSSIARFEKFGIDIASMLEVNFNFLEFRSGSSQKTDVRVDINPANPIIFKGALSFVNSLQSIIPSTGFSGDGPYIDLQPTGVKAGFNISIPSVEVGICSICNISLGACITLPFTGDPLTIGFNFCTRENPFLLTVSCFGGGGFFMLVTTLHGIQSVEAAFEFGASLSLNIGVASGGVSVMGGFYFKIEKIIKVVASVNHEVSQVTLTGYIRINGRLSVLGLITVSIEFYLALTAVFVGDKVEKIEGEATLKVKVEVLFFSKTVSLSVRRELAGADADPKFIDMIDQDDWQQYCLAFAS